MRPAIMLCGLVWMGCVTVLADATAAKEADVLRVQFRNQGSSGKRIRTVVGEVIVEAQDGGVMMLADDGHLWTLQPEQIQKRTSVTGPLSVVSEDAMEQRLLEEVGGQPGEADFAIHRTDHYWIVYNSSEAYAKRVGGLFESLYRSFYTYWENQHWDLPEPRFPLVAVLLKDRKSFVKYGKADIGDSVENMIGYYNLSTNRMTTFNVPNWERNVSTIIHEATHQLAYNCGLQTRFADNPMWVSEGLATFFESPDRRKPGRWRGVGRVNRTNLARWQRYQRNRPTDSLGRLLSDDNRYRNTATAADAYGEGWALTYFLMKARRKQYVQYLRQLSEGKPLAVQSPRSRIEMFESALGADLDTIDRQFVKFMRRVR
jgi:hypothetical protein